eukprot:6057109-Pleurochrysis_carterae.AAC.1
METMSYMGRRAILGCIVLEAVVYMQLRAKPWRLSTIDSSCRILVFGWTIMYMWGHPVATLASDEGDYTSLSQNDVNFANHHPFPGDDPTMPGS